MTGFGDIDKLFRPKSTEIGLLNVRVTRYVHGGLIVVRCLVVICLKSRSQWSSGLRGVSLPDRVLGLWV